MKIIINENQKYEVLKKMLFKYWDSLGYVNGNASSLKLFNIQPYRERQLIDQFIVEWYESRGKDRFEQLKKDFTDLQETSDGVYKSILSQPKEFNIKDDGFNFWISIHTVTLNTKSNWLELDGEIDFDSLTHNGEYVTNIPVDEMSDEEYFQHFNEIREDAFIKSNRFFINRYGNTMALDIELTM